MDPAREVRQDPADDLGGEPGVEQAADLLGPVDVRGAVAAGSLAGGLVLSGTGPAGLPWVTLAFTGAALGTIAAAKRHAFPPERWQERGIPGHAVLLPRA